jgi:signal transduction histidine kinase
VLGVISRSPSQLQPVLDTIVATASRLCSAEYAGAYRLRDGLYHLSSANNVEAAFIKYIAKHPIAPGRGSLVGRTAVESKTIHIPDCLVDPEYTFHENQRIGKFRSMLGVPLLREGVPIGVISLVRTVVKPFTDRQIELVTTFADQAVIAIENTRLFEAEQASKRELQESLQQQTATADVLKVISRSAFDLQAVLDTLVEAVARLCEADMAQILRPRDASYYVAAKYGFSLDYIEYHKAVTFAPGRGSLTGRVLLEGKPVQIPDVLADPEYDNPEPQRLGGYRTHLGVPLLRGGSQIGVILVSRRTVQPFDGKQIELVTTFADQAVIAIENTRLFEEVQARNNELRVALEQQTATSELLKVIGRSTMNLQPVFETLAENAVRLCVAERSFIYRFDGQFLRVAATYNASPELRAFVEQNPIEPGRGSATARAALERRTVQVLDAQADPEYSYASRQVDPIRTIMTVPILRGDELLGAIGVYRHEVRAFTESQIALLETFADQAVIAIENTRLFEEVQSRTQELQESLRQQAGTADVLKTISRSAFDLQRVLDTLTEAAARLCGADKGLIRRRERDHYVVASTYGFSDEFKEWVASSVLAASRGSIVGRVALERTTVHIPDVFNEPDWQSGDWQRLGDFRSMIGVPLLRDGDLLGILVLHRTRAVPFTEKQIELVESFADQAVIAIENTRLFEEVQARTAELAKTVEDLEIASQHKSQFVANMSHELRTPLAAILGYAELMQEGFYEPLGQKSLDALTRIRSNSKHLLGLINTVLDIAKIESGQFTLNMAEYAIESVVETVRAATESLADTKKLALKTEVAKSLPVGLGDEQRLTQVLLNLVGNAIKFTDTGEVRVTARAVSGHFNVSVADTGPGIPEQERTRIFDQFHQVDSSLTKAKGGTGLGLAIAKQIVEMHGGRIWVESTLGKGSTFQMELPTRVEFRKMAP